MNVTDTRESTATRVNLLDFDHAALTEWCASIGEKPFRATQLSRWLHRHVECDFDKMTNLAKVFRAKLKDLAEVRSVAVHPDLQRKGIGRLLVQDLIKDARALGAAHVFTFTLAPGFFSSLGFAAVDRDTLSPVVWAECSKCPKFYKCDEVGMMLHF